MVIKLTAAAYLYYLIRPGRELGREIVQCEGGNTVLKSTSKYISGRMPRSPHCRRFGQTLRNLVPWSLSLFLSLLFS
jgi:hypothetical protein